MVSICKKESPTWLLVSQILLNPITAPPCPIHLVRSNWVCLNTSIIEVAGHNFPYFCFPTFILPQMHYQHLRVKLLPSWCNKWRIWTWGRILHACSKETFPRNVGFCLFKTSSQVGNFTACQWEPLWVEEADRLHWSLSYVSFFPVRTFIWYHDNGAWRESYHQLWEN